MFPSLLESSTAPWGPQNLQKRPEKSRNTENMEVRMFEAQIDICSIGCSIGTPATYFSLGFPRVPYFLEAVTRDPTRPDPIRGALASSPSQSVDRRIPG